MLKRNYASAVVLIVMLSTQLQPRFMIAARWIDAKHAEIQWSVPGCLYRIPANTNAGYFLGCSKSPGKMILPGDGPNDFSLFPKEGDTYRLLTDDNQIYNAVLPRYIYKIYAPFIVHLRNF